MSSSSKDAVILVVITFLLVVLIYSSIAKFEVFGLPKIQTTCSHSPVRPDGSQISTCCTVKFDKNLNVIPGSKFCNDCYFYPDETKDVCLKYYPRAGPPSGNNTVTFLPGSIIKVPPGTTNTLTPAGNNTNSSVARAAGVYSPTPNNGTTTAMKATGGCIPGGSTCVPCDIGLARIGANCIPSGDWHPTNGLPPLSTLQQQQQQPITPPPTTLPPSSTLQQQQQQPITTTCPDGSQPDANGNCPSTTTSSPQQPTPPSPNQGGTTTTESPPSLSTSQQQQTTTTLCPDGSAPDANGNCPNTGSTSNQQPTAATCPDGSQPDANGKCPTGSSSTTSHPPLSPLTNTKNQEGSNNNNNVGTNPIKHCSKTNAGGPHCPKAG